MVNGTCEHKIFKLFHKACADYSLLEDGDRVLVALSGGKDSLELVRLLGRQQTILKPRIEVEAAHIVMDNIPYHSDEAYLRDFCDAAGVHLNVIHTAFDESTDRRKTKCFLCSWYRRKALFTYAQENSFNKLALGHHQDDFITTLLMNMIYQGRNETMSPLMKMRHYPISVIRPLCLVAEEDIASIAESEGFHKQKAACPYEDATRRKDMNELFHHIMSLNPEARYTLWRAIEKG